MPQECRYFTYHDDKTGKEHGRYRIYANKYSSVSPMNAAKKCATKLLRDSGVNSMDICIREITRGSKKKLYRYHVSRIQLVNPIQIYIGNRTVTYNYKTDIKYIPRQKPPSAKKSPANIVVCSTNIIDFDNYEKMIIEI